MARKKKHEEHVNAEAWAIPYGDLVTLLFALFTVMYAMSSVNEGKFRVLSDSMIAAFNGAPKSMRPVNIGEKEPGKGGDKQLTGVTPTVFIQIKQEKSGADGGAAPRDPTKTEASTSLPGALIRMQRQVQDAMQSLIDAKLVTVRRENMWLEIEINADILFPSGSGEFAPAAEPVLDKLAEVLKPFPNPIRVEGHTDDRPIRTAAFPSNWELSAARAASVVHQFTRQGIDPLRLEIVGFGEFHPRQTNETTEGRNANRRVVVLVLEEVAPGAPVTARTTDQTPEAAAPGVELAESSGATNRLMTRTPPAALEQTMLIKSQTKSQQNEQPKTSEVTP
ncbi:MAG TPA: flagellar motor protein MotD [Steroidobacteraceae bacterium]|jgi:chemotaxis protein MotB|nr:flagellar motor protein MotD [Steroidobacteraceae bacterium]